MKISMKLCSRLIILFILLLAGCQPVGRKEEQTASPQAEVSNTPVADASLRLSLLTEGTPTQFAPLEFSIEGVPTISNPFAIEEVDLQITFAGPDGITATVGGFWYQDYATNGEQTQGEAGCRARFTPIVGGEWHSTATLQPPGLASNELTIQATESSAPGFVRLDPDNPRYFAYDDGSRFLPIGVNMGWWSDDPIENYTRWLDHFAAIGGNTIRVWMANWSFALEWNDTGLGDYRLRLRQAWLLDQLSRIAGERGVKIILVLNHHGQFSKTVNAQWQENPYNAELGGPLDSLRNLPSTRTRLPSFNNAYATLWIVGEQSLIYWLGNGGTNTTRRDHNKFWMFSTRLPLTATA